MLWRAKSGVGQGRRERPYACHMGATEDAARRRFAAARARRIRRTVHYLGIWYFDTQSFTVVQSRLSKNASMYDARSVW
jgi:hypothetical protein